MTVQPISFCVQDRDYRCLGLWNFIVGPDTSLQEKGLQQSKEASDKAAALQQEQIDKAQTQSDALDAQTAARKKAAKTGGRAQLLTGNELGVTSTGPSNASTTLG